MVLLAGALAWLGQDCIRNNGRLDEQRVKARLDAAAEQMQTALANAAVQLESIIAAPAPVPEGVIIIFVEAGAVQVRPAERLFFRPGSRIL